MLESNRIISLKYPNEYLDIGAIEVVDIDKYCYRASIIENHLSDRLQNLLRTFWEDVNNFSMALVDQDEELIQDYQLSLFDKETKVFRVEIVEEYVYFFSKYPTSDGFLDDY